jgi:membrane protein implicated in regulation of membrane protease activity
MLTKKEWCVLVLAGCLLGLAGAAVVLAALWLVVNRPVFFWQVVIVALMAALCVMFRREWRWRRRPRPELWACDRCGKRYTLDKLMAHRCGGTGVTVLKLKD